MASQSGIEWTDATWNPVRARVSGRGGNGGDESRTGWHCEHVSEGCRNCYAEALNRRLGTGLDFKPGHRGGLGIFLDEKLLTGPLRWKRPRTIFLSSMTDIFADFVSDGMLDRLFAVMALSRQHFFRILTKRPERMRAYLTAATGPYDTGHACGRIADLIDGNLEAWGFERTGIVPLPWGRGGDRWWPLPNVGLGVSVEDQASAEERIPPLLDTPAAMRFVSAEPLLGPVRLRWLRISVYRGVPLGETGYYAPAAEPHRIYSGLDEVIAGGESGAVARPLHPDWVRSLRDQCAEAGVPFFFKQWGEWAPAHPDGAMVRIGKKAAGAMLDGREHRAAAQQVRAHFEKLGRAG
jgi:protein gp37